MSTGCYAWLMSSQFVRTQTVKTYDDILGYLKDLNQQLMDMNLDKLIPFNHAYYIVTRTIQEAANDKYFTNPEFLEAFSVCFANYYFQAVNDLNNNSNKVVPAWRKIVDNRKQPIFVSLLMGANAHINYDLSLTLIDMMSGANKRELLSDIIKVDKLLTKSSKEILNTFNETNKLLDFIKRHARWLYLRPIMLMILFWRTVAWRNYRLVDNRDINAQDLVKRSTKISKRLSNLGAILSGSVKL